MELSRLLEKVGRGQRLTESELLDMRTQVRDLEQTKNLVKSWVNAGTATPIFQPVLEQFHSKILEEDMASLTIPIPSSYSHLILTGSGRSTDSASGSDHLLAQYNGDTGANYTNQKLFVVGTTVTAELDSSQSNSIVGLLSKAIYPAGQVSSFFTIIPNYTSNTLSKNSLTISSANFGSILFFGSNWNATVPISSVKFYSGTDNIAAGSLISVYGIR